MSAQLTASTLQAEPGSSHGLLAGVTTPQLADALDALGYRDCVMDGRIGPLAGGTRALGRAATVQFGPVDHDVEEPYDAAIAFIDALEPGAMVVIATGGEERSAYWGELFSAAALGRHARGVVCDSFLRDSLAVSALGFPAFGTGTRPIDFRARMAIIGAGASVRCGGVAVNPGELILADADGVVCVPAPVEAQAVAAANAKAARERTVLDELRGGATLRSVWERHRVL